LNIFLFETRISPQGVSGKGSECANRISGADLVIVFHSKYGSLLFGSRDMTAGRTTDGLRRTDRRRQRQPSHIWPLRRVSNDGNNVDERLETTKSRTNT